MTEIQNRILKTAPIQWRNLEWLQGNLKEMSKTSFAKLKASLLKNSFIQPFNVWENGKLWVLDGHHRKKAMEELEKEGHKIPDELPANFVDCKDLKEAKKLVLIYSSIYARANEETLYEFISTNDLDFDELKLEMDLPEINLPKFEVGYMTDEVIEDEVPEPPTVPKTVKGDLYELGRHRLLCGDSTNSDDVARLMDGKKADLMVTDPPYGVEYDAEWRQKAAEEGHLAYGAARFGKVTNDSRSSWLEAYSLFTGDVAYVWHASASASAIQFAQDIIAAGFEIRNQIIWRKPTFAISRGNYHWQHEPCWYAVRKGAKSHWIGDHSQTTIWDISNRIQDHTEHSTEKPIALMLRPMRNHEGDVYDPFLGSGSTLIAAEQTDRNCYGMEIEPKYCDVIVQRYVNFTKSNTVKLNGKEIEWQGQDSK